MAEDIVIQPSRGRVTTGLPAGVDAALAVVDMSGKGIGAFEFAPGAEGDATSRIAVYDQRVREDFDADADIVFLGRYGSGHLFVSPLGVAWLDILAQPPRIRPFARDFTCFLIAQANAYEADLRFLGQAADLTVYRAAAVACAALPAMAEVEVMAIFEAQRTG